ncbi:hypothetical protein ACFZC6_40825 [Streptomyces ossamyceticus]|uniref:hypothetical protein n=1 Tax=Streptomyces ossamyceticus TaxID=249581 RepID=UPI0036EB503C
MAVRVWRPGAVGTAVVAAVVAVTLGAGGTASAAGYTGVAGPWSSAAALTGADGQQTLIAVRAAGDGTAFALWRNRAAGAGTWDFEVVVKAAGGSTWGAPHTLATGRSKGSLVELTVTPTGQAVVTWLDGGGAAGDPTALAATWNPAQGGWSAPAPIATTTGVYLGLPRLAAAADGTLTAVWDQGDFADYDVMTATRAPGATTWSTAKPLAHITTGSVYDLALAVAPDGAATAVWDVYDQVPEEGEDAHTVHTATRASAGGAWSSAAPLPGTAGSAGTVRVTMDAKGATTVLWRAAAGGATALKSATRTSVSGGWGAPQTAVAAIDPSDESEPLTAPNGDLTYVWAGWSSTAGTPVVRTVTRTASTGTWSAPKTLSTGYVKWDVSASIGADGTVQVVWPQTPSIDNGDDNYLEWAVRPAGGTWSAASALNSAPVPAVPDENALSGEVTAGPDGRATVVFRKAVDISPGDFTSQLSAQSQTLLTKPKVTSRAAVSGTARTGSKVTCGAAWTGYDTTVAWSWLRDGTTITGATGKSRTLTSADYKHQVSCRAKVSNGAGSVTSTSAAVTVAVGPALKAVTAPAVTGTAKVGYKLTAAHGTWSPAATSYTYSWKRDGTTITGATSSTYVLAKADKGHKITVKVTAKRYGWTNGSATTAGAVVR